MFQFRKHNGAWSKRVITCAAISTNSRMTTKTNNPNINPDHDRNSHGRRVCARSWAATVYTYAQLQPYQQYIIIIVILIIVTIIIILIIIITIYNPNR